MKMALSERPAYEADSHLAELRSAIEDLVGDRAKVQVLGGTIIVSPMARNLHMLIVTALRRALDRNCDPEKIVVTERAEFVVDSDNRPQPDLAVMHTEALERDLMATASPASDALLVVEVTSPSNAVNDRKRGLKYKAYAKGMVPIYLLVDPSAEDGPSITAFTQPTGIRYQGEHTLPFGTPLRLPEPFDAVVIDSSRFPVSVETEG